MDFLANGQQQKKNPTGIAVVVLLHVAAVAFALQNSTVTLTRSLPNVIDVLTEPPVPLPEPDPPKMLAEPQLQPPPAIAVPKVEVQDLAPADTPVLSTRTVGETTPPQAGGNTVTATATEPAARPAPVRTAAIVDARACKRPDYPRNALRNGETGTVTLALLIGTDGKVVESKIEGSSGSRELDRAAQAGLSLCRFQPGTVDGAPQQSWTRMQYVWNLDY